MMVSYQVHNNKFCERIGRAHKSNHITLVVEMMVRGEEEDSRAKAVASADASVGASAGAGAGVVGGAEAGGGDGTGAAGTSLSVSGTWHQRCWDPDCAGYRSPARPLPPPLLGELALCFK